MRRNAYLFGGLALFFSAAGVFLRVTELSTLLHRDSMLMDFGAVSVILLVVAALALVCFALLVRRWEVPQLPARYGPVFRGAGNLTVNILCFAASLFGAVLYLLRWRREGDAFSPWLALLAVLMGCGWLSLGLDACLRKTKGCTVAAAGTPVAFAALLLICFYRRNAPIPAMLYTMYPFLALVADMLALHLIAGFAGERLRPRLTVYLCGAAVVLSMISLPSATEAEVRLFLAVFAVQAFSHAVTLLTPRAFEAADFSEASENASEKAASGEAAESTAAEAPEAAEAGESPEAAE